MRTRRSAPVGAAPTRRWSATAATRRRRGSRTTRCESTRRGCRSRRSWTSSWASSRSADEQHATSGVERRTCRAVANVARSSVRGHAVSEQAPGEEFRFMPPEHMWKLARVIIQSWFAPMMQLRVYGGDRVPEGAAVVASNHIAGDDPIVLGMACRRSIRYMAKIELWRIPVVRTLIPHTGAFPVDRGNADRTTIMHARTVLRTGNLLGIFVEGTRQSTDEIGAARTGAAMCAVLEHARIIPACLI